MAEHPHPPHPPHPPHRRAARAMACAASAIGLHAWAVAADDAAGRAAFDRCSACHTLAAAPAADGVGPSLHGLLGRRAGTAEGFRYSGPLKRSGIVWTADTLAAFLRDPQGLVPGNRMAFSGIGDEAELRALVAYLAGATAPTASRKEQP